MKYSAKRIETQIDELFEELHATQRMVHELIVKASLRFS